MDLTEAKRHVDRERRTLYLDGPNDIDWIFRNDITQRREEAMYLDYVAYRDHFHDEHVWYSPNPRLLRGCVPAVSPTWSVSRRRSTALD